jgi:hypothetical protein
MAATITATITMAPMIMKIFFFLAFGNFPKGQGDLADGGGNGGGLAAIIKIRFL